MKITDTQLHVLSHIKIDVTFQDLEQKIKTTSNSLEILKTAEKMLNQVKGIWEPRAVYQWFEFEDTGRDDTGKIIQSSGCHMDFDFGHSFQFLKYTRHALISVYTAGQELEKESKKPRLKGICWVLIFLTLLG